MAEPLEAAGFAPNISMWSVRSRSGTGNTAALPRTSPLTTCCGLWSSDDAEQLLRLPSAARNAKKE